MKKTLSLAFILSLVFALTACGQTIHKETDTTENKETKPITESGTLDINGGNGYEGFSD